MTGLLADQAWSFSASPNTLKVPLQSGTIQHLKQTPGTPQAGLTPEGLRLQKTLASKAEDPISTLRSRLQAGTASPEVARVCLEVYFTQLLRLSRRDRRQQMCNDDVGALSLKWLWSEDHRWVGPVTEDVKSLEMMCYFAVAEGLDGLLVEWLMQPLATQNTVD